METNKAAAGLVGLTLTLTFMGWVLPMASATPPTAETIANFYSAQNPAAPPLPFVPFAGLDVYFLSNNAALYDDLQINYVELRSQNALLNTLQSALEGPPSPGPLGEGGNSGDSSNALGGLSFTGSCTGRLLSPQYLTTNLVLSITGATSGDQYDLYSTPNLNLTNWTYLGRWTNAAASWTIVNPPTNESYYAVGCVDNHDHDGLPDVYETFVMHTDPNDPDTDYDGRSDYEESIQEGTLPLDATSFTPVRLGYFRFNDASFTGERGQLPLTTNNLQSVEAWVTKGVQLTNATAALKYRTVETDGRANINLRSGTVRFWFKPLWNSGIGTGAAGKLLEVGARGVGTTNGWWSVFVNLTGDTVYFVSQTNNAVEVTNLTASVSFTSNRWSQLVLTYTNGAVALYTNGVLCASNTASLPYPPLATRVNGFAVGCSMDSDGVAKGVFEDLETFNYPLNANDILENFQLTQPPSLIPNLQQWLMASQVLTNTPDRIDVWLDQSGNANNAGSSGSTRPYWTNNVLNGLPVVHFDGNVSFDSYLGSFVTNWTAVEAFVVLRTAANKPAGSPGLWRFGASGNSYPSAAGEIIEGFAMKTGTRNVGSISQGLTNFHVYNPLSRLGEWTARINGVVKFTTGSNAVGFAASHSLGLGGSARYEGDVAELLLFNRALTATERQGVNSYLSQRYQIPGSVPQPPTNLTANVLSPGQISLWWNRGTNNEQTAYTVERSVDGIHFSASKRVEGNSLIDSGLATNTAYFYRVKAGNLAGESGYTTSITATSAMSGVDMPLDPAVLKLWLKPDAGAMGNYDGTLESWLDVSGNTNVLICPGADSSKRPYWLASTSGLNGHPAIRFYDTNWFEIRFLNTITTWTSAEAFVVLKARLATNTTSSGLWRIGQGNELYPDSAGRILETFARDTHVVISNVAQLIVSPHLFNPASQPGDWTARINGTNVFTISPNSVAFYPSTPLLGVGLNGFDGDIVECLIYNQVLTTSQRSTATDYLRRKYNLW